VEERRKYKRVKTQNLISYFSFDETGKLTSHGLGIALDISKGGILLETPDSIKSGLIVLAATDREKNLFEVRGELAYSKKTSTGTYFSGIKFNGVNERVIKFITKLVKEYSYQGYNLFYRRHNQDLPPTPHEST
jgi:c-di-GMP-binding flagellar brake protein YcgR